MLVFSLLWMLAGVRASADVFTIPPETPNKETGSAFVGFSIELSSFPDYAGNTSHPNGFSYNLLKTISALTGTIPYIRVGGNTQDYALYNASLDVGLVGIVNPALSSDYPTTVWIGPAFFESYQTWPGARFSHGFNLAHGANSAAGWQTLVDTAPLACKAIGSSGHYTWEYGNEPNDYATSMTPSRPPSWNESEYVSQWLNGTREIQKQMRIHCPDLAYGDYLDFMAPSYDDRVTNLKAWVVWKDGLDKYADMRWYSVHNYIDGAMSPGVTLQGTLMNHTQNTLNIDQQMEVYKRFISKSSEKPPIIFGETNSLYDEGRPGLSNTFGAALWGVDFNLYSASAGFKRVHMHQGTNYRYQSWQPIETEDTVKGTKAPYYGNIAVAAALGDSEYGPISISSIRLPSDTESAYAIYSNHELKRIMLINMQSYNTTEDGAGLTPLPDPQPRGHRTYSFQIGDHHSPPISAQVQRLMANGSDAITGVSFDGWSFNWELDNGRPVKLNNITTGEVVKSSEGIVTVQVPDSSAALLQFGFEPLAQIFQQ